MKKIQVPTNDKPKIVLTGELQTLSHKLILLDWVRPKPIFLNNIKIILNQLMEHLLYYSCTKPNSIRCERMYMKKFKVLHWSMIRTK